MTRLPGALFVVDIKREHIAIREAQKLKIPIFAMVDTNSDPRQVEYVIPSNDDATKSIDKIMTLVTDALAEGLQERKKDKEVQQGSEEQVAPATAPVEAKAETPVEKAPEVKTETKEETSTDAVEGSKEA